jgi:hypothetical protein
MKPLQKIKISLLLMVAITMLHGRSISQDTAIKAEPAIRLGYFVNNKGIPFLQVESLLKKGKKFEVLPAGQMKIYLDSMGAGNLLNELNTGKTGKVRVVVPASFQSIWNNSPKHNFIAILKNKPGQEDITESLEITKARMSIDTTTMDGARTISVKILYNNQGEWLPAKDVEVKVGALRAGGLLTAGEESYTTDSTGMVQAAFTRDSLPGDTLGNIVIAARVEDNDTYGNLLVEKTVPWGRPTKIDLTFFDKRTLWSTAFRAPGWLLFMAYSIAIIVWGTLIYLITQIVKIKRLGVRSQ